MLTVRDELPCSPQAFWDLYFSEGFQERLYRQGLGFTEFELLSHTQRGQERDQQLRLKPPGLPRIVEKAMGEPRYVETGRFDGRVWHFHMQPGGERIRVEGRFWVDATAKGCLRTCEVKVAVQLFGVGKAVAKALEANVADNQAKAVAFLRSQL